MLPHDFDRHGDARELLQKEKDKKMLREDKRVSSAERFKKMLKEGWKIVSKLRQKPS